MRVTQQDIAKIAKVSQATVSRVLAGDDKVELAIQKRVRAVIAEHNYQPDVRARSLRNRRTGLIGLVVNRPLGGLNDDPFFANLVSEIIDYLSGRPYHLCLDMVSDESGQRAIYDDMLRSRRVDGLILVESEARDERIARLQHDRFPFVLIGNPLANDQIHSVDNDNVLAAEMATRHLMENGYQNIGFIGGRRGITVSDDRITGYLRALGRKANQDMIWHCGFGPESARETTLRALRAPTVPDAFVVLDDFMAMGVVSAAREARRSIPADLGIVSFNDSNLCDLPEGGLTSVSLNISAIVRAACDQLLAIIEEREPVQDRRTIVPCELHVRGSSNGNRKVVR